MTRGMSAKMRRVLKANARLIVTGDFNDGNTTSTRTRSVCVRTGKRTVVLRHNKSKKKRYIGITHNAFYYSLKIYTPQTHPLSIT